MSTTSSSPSSLLLPTMEAEDQLGLALEGKLPREGVSLKRSGEDLVASPSPSVIFRNNGGGSFGSAHRSGHGSFGSSGYGSGSGNGNGSGYFGTLPVYRHRKTYNNTSEEDSPANPIDFKFKQLGNGDLAADVTVLARERIRSRSSSIDGAYSIPSPYFTSAQIPANQNSLETFNSLQGETSSQNSIHQISSSSIDSESYASATDSVGDFRFVSEFEELPWWSNEDFATMCSLCFSEFGFFVRKHHCRYCGSVVCFRCSTLKVKMRWLGYSEPVRICDRCRGPVKLIAAQERDDAPPSFPHLSQYQQHQQRRQREPKHRERTLLNENDEDEEQEEQETGVKEEEDIYTRKQRKSKVKQPYKVRVITEMSDSEGKWWLVLLSRWDTTPGTKRQIVGQKIWKGLPVPLRGKVWQVVSGARAARFQDHQLFSNLLDRLEQNELSADIWESIVRDVTRTYPDHPHFREVYSLGQRGLIRILAAFALHNKDIGYAQGMNFICGILLMQMDEESAFWVFYQLMSDEYKVGRFFQAGTQHLENCLSTFDSLVRRTLPRLHRHFEKERFSVSVLAQQWFRTLFSYSLPHELVWRIWDIFFVEGMSIISWIGLLILKQHEEALLQLPFFGASQFLRDRISANAIEKVLDKQTL